MSLVGEPAFFQPTKTHQRTSDQTEQALHLPYCDENIHPKEECDLDSFTVVWSYNWLPLQLFAQF